MPLDVEPLTAPDQLEALLRESASRPVLIFKHSRSCGTSAHAFDELRDHLRQGASTARYAVVTVQTHRAVSNDVATRLGIRHETPQALLIVDGRVVWQASHYRVTAHAITQAIESHLVAAGHG
jgi:bacillithiol system protein YtxJ